MRDVLKHEIKPVASSGSYPLLFVRFALPNDFFVTRFVGVQSQWCFAAASFFALGALVRIGNRLALIAGIEIWKVIARRSSRV